MPIFSWNIRRQLAAIAIFAVFVFLVIGGIIYFFQPAPTCFDKRQNQDEEGVDCGGACAPCSEKVQNLAVLWTRFFPVREGVYEIAALIENRNQFLKTEKFIYSVKLYDDENILMAIRENRTFANAGEKFIIFEPDFLASNRVPKRAILDISGISWETAEPKPLPVDVLTKNIFLTSFPPRLEVAIKNRENKFFENIEATAVLLGNAGEVLGVSKTFLRKIGLQETANLVFTWPEPIENVSAADIYLRQSP